MKTEPNYQVLDIQTPSDFLNAYLAKEAIHN